jgi:hypothetical protein
MRTWRLRFRATADRLVVWYQQRTCPHLFKAALINKGPGRVCKICDVAQTLSREDFYAEFGERYQAMLYPDVPPAVRRESHPAFIETDRVQ